MDMMVSLLKVSRTLARAGFTADESTIDESALDESHGGRMHGG
ncbi:hypothetical protein [Luteimonas notoginsengisoli]